MEETTKEKLFYAIVQELPVAIKNYLSRANIQGASSVAGFNFDMFLHKADGGLISDKLHIILANDKVGGIFKMFCAAGQDKLEKIYKILTEE